MKKVALLAFSLVIAFFLLPGGMATWQDSLSVEGRITTTKWTGRNSFQSDFSVETYHEGESLTQELQEEPDEVEKEMDNAVKPEDTEKVEPTGEQEVEESTGDSGEVNEEFLPSDED